MDSAASVLADEIKSRSADGAAKKLAPLGGGEIAATLMRLSPGFGQDVLAALPDEARERVFAAAPPDVTRQWQRNALYDEDAIGRMMEPVIGAFHPSRTVGETIEALREMVKSSFITYVWVVEEDERLSGIVTMRDLLFSSREVRLADVMLKNPFALHAWMSLKDAMKQVLDRHYPVYPVVDAEGRLLGLVRGQAMFEAQAIEITLQAGSMVGVHEEERLATPWDQSLKMRHPWLQLNLLTAFLAAAVVGLFQDTIDRLVILALFLPVLAGQSGNTGCQALAVTLRGMTLGELKPGTERPLVKKEAWLGCLNGIGVGLAAAVGMFITATGQTAEHPWMLAFVVFLAMIGSCVASGVSGAMVPLTLKRLGFDPATASSIFLTTATDVVSMGMLLGLATLLIR
ncbi:MAG: magnesium transporter [Betaproteobacteria bacterium RIFCSPLOWO2_12_FULL_65_14]|nr:MAG: magnesium transporter [Betaproteobacteria bacterium RIFCSPLOWO2_12_FULL_65_14]